MLLGLAEKEAASRLAAEGPNELPQSRPRGAVATIADVMKEPMLLLLVGGGAIYLALGDAKEALILLAFVFVVIAISYYQERKTERALAALRDLSSPRALVIRDGERRRIAGREVVRGDLVVLAEGDRVPADGALIWAASLSVDESLLTGESVPVVKQADRAAATAWIEGRRTEDVPAAPADRPGGDGTPFVFSGTLVVSGQGIAEVRAVASGTELGRIGTALESLAPEETPLQGEVRRFVRDLAVFGLVLAAVVVVVYALTRDDWLGGLLAGITLSMAMLPEEFPVVLTVFLALGAWRLSLKNVLTRRMPAVETLGSATVLCVDKTGTLTQNRMTVTGLWADGLEHRVPAPEPMSCPALPEPERDAAVPEELTLPDVRPQATVPEHFHELVEFGILASQRDPFDPMEKAFDELGTRALTGTEHLHAEWHLVREYPLSAELLAISHVWASPDERRYVIAAKGAPEAIVDLCHLDKGTHVAVARATHEMADDGLRVLGIARAFFEPGSDGADGLPQGQHDFPFELVGLVGLADPVRPEVPDAVAECYRAGLRVLMITGDYPGTAQAIAREIGLEPVDRFVTGPEMESMDDDDLAAQAAQASIFSRVVPEQKLRIVRALKGRGEVVAMTGDGVNDAPALKAAHIGVAMGGRGTDVAREASSLVLTDDAFDSIVAAVRMGRRIFDNLRKAMSYILAVHVPIAGMSLLPVAFGWPLVLMPVHVAFLELIIDPACSVVFEAQPEGDDIMHRPPRALDDPLMGRSLVGLSLAQGAVVFAVVSTVFVVALEMGRAPGETRALTFTTLVVANIALILANLSWSRPIVRVLAMHNPALWAVMAGAVAILGLALYLPAGRSTFGFDVLHATDIAVCLGAGLVSVLWFEGLKLAGVLRGRR